MSQLVQLQNKAANAINVVLAADAGNQQRVTISFTFNDGTAKSYVSPAGAGLGPGQERILTNDTVATILGVPAAKQINHAVVLCENNPGGGWSENTYAPFSPLPLANGVEVRSDDTPPNHVHTWVNCRASFTW
jgi:hypothetical protein